MQITIETVRFFALIIFFGAIPALFVGAYLTMKPPFTMKVLVAEATLAITEFGCLLLIFALWVQSLMHH